MREWGEIGRLCPEKFAYSGSFNWICFEESSSKVIPGTPKDMGPLYRKFPIRASHICDRDSGLGIVWETYHLLGAHCWGSLKISLKSSPWENGCCPHSPVLNGSLKFLDDSF